MEFLVAYDVNTETPEGKRRLRRVAHICEGFGQRVQKSVFECRLSPADLEVLIHQLGRVVKVEQDSLRIYRLREPANGYLILIGRQPKYDLDEPLVL